MKSAFDDFSVETREYATVGCFLTFEAKANFINSLEDWMFSIPAAKAVFGSIKRLHLAGRKVVYQEVVTDLSDNQREGYKAEHETFIKRAVESAYPIDKKGMDQFISSASLRQLESNLEKVQSEIKGGKYDYETALNRVDRIRVDSHQVVSGIKEFEPGNFYTQRMQILKRREETKQIFFGRRSLDELIVGGQRKKELSIIASRPNMGKCHRASTLIQTQRGDIPISEIKIGDFVNSLTEDSLKLESKKVLNVINQGYQDLYRLKLKNLNYSIDSTVNHPFLTINGWKSLSDLKVGDAVAVPKFLISPSQLEKYSVNFSRLVGYLIGDGSLTKGVPTFTGSHEIINDVEFILYDVYKSGVEVYIKKSCDKYSHVSLSKVARSKLENPLTKDLRDLGLMGKNSFDKFIPNELLISKEHIRQLLIGLWDTDGSSEGYGTVSLRLAKDVQRLLLYFGVITQLHRRKTKWQNGEGYSWRVRLTRTESIILFWDEIGKFLLSSLKRNQLSDKYCRCKSLDGSHSNYLNFPKEVWEMISEYIDLRILLKEMTGRAKGNLKRMISQGVSRSRLERIIRLIKSKEVNPVVLKSLISNDVYWAEVDSIEPVGSDLTYDLEIEDNHNFVAEGFVTHNSAAKANLIKAQAGLGFRVASVATEQTEEVETDRIDSLNTGIPLKEISNSREWPDGDKRFKKIIDSNKYIDENWKYFLNVRRNIGTEGVAAWLRSIVNKYGEIDVCYIDLFDKLTDINVREKSDSLIGAKLGYLNQVAEELNIHICLLVQIHRAAVKDVKSDHRPKIHNLKGAGAYEEVARLVILLHREKYYNSKVVEDIIEFNVAKQNNGPAGDNITANLLFEKETLTIKERSQSVPNIY